MVKIMELLTKVIEQIEKDNPYKLVFKGGTALSILYLNHHRESEDLDFDADIKYLEDYKDIQDYFIGLFEGLKRDNIIMDYKIGKTGLAKTNRFHMKIQFISYKTFHTKLDIDFIEPSDKLKQRGELLFYSIERMFTSKVITFTERQEFKDFIDIAYMLPKIDFTVYDNKMKLAELLLRMIDTVDEKSLIARYDLLSRNVDLKARGLRKGDIYRLIERTFRDIRATINTLKR
ncbi:MAG: nucleotidyl transferase AbiEii/AbiGii toxin family protein [Thermoplasmata archaeon]|nr:MAG: nucleotidyl transferase AbiEii/AbiGii toxin family protein [Thermoplasmata archaeon]